MTPKEAAGKLYTMRASAKPDATRASARKARKPGRVSEAAKTAATVGATAAGAVGAVKMVEKFHEYDRPGFGTRYPGGPLSGLVGTVAKIAQEKDRKRRKIGA